MNKMQKRLFLLKGVECLRVSRFSKLTAFLFSFFSLTVALFSREWQVAYRTEMSTIMVTAPATHTQNTHTGSRALTRRGGCTHLTKTQKKNSKTAVREGFITAQVTSSVSMHASTSADSISVREIVCAASLKKKKKKHPKMGKERNDVNHMEEIKSVVI